MQSLVVTGWGVVASLLVAAVGTWLVLHVLVRVAPHVGLMDAPGGHRIHERSTPLVGGIAVLSGFFFAVLTLDVPLTAMRPLFLASALLILTGLLDDLHELSPWSRFAAQIGAGLVMTLWGGVILRDMGQLVGPDLATLGRWSVPLTIVATVGVINSFNMSDGMDGQAGCLFLITFAGLGYLLWVADVRVDLLVLLLLACCIAVFLSYNLRIGGRTGALTFLGNAGSMFLGFVLSWYLVKYSQGENRAFHPVTALWLVALPLCDTVAVMLRRALEGRSPVAADRTHYHHLLQHFGLSVNRSLLVIAATAVVFCAIGVGSEVAAVRQSTMFYWFLGWFAVYFVATWLLVHRLHISTA